MRFIALLSTLFLVVLPVLLYWLGFPIAAGHRSTSSAIFGIGIVYLIIVSALYGARISRWGGYQSAQKIINVFFPLLALSVSLFFVSVGFKLPLAVAFILLLTMVTVFSHVFAAGDRVKDGGIVSLLCCLALLFITELTLRSIPEAFVIPEVVQVPPLAQIDRGHQFFQAHGFRDRKPCQNCSADLVRIVTMGGSSTYGIPMRTNAHTYSAELQKLLNQRRANEHYEVLNAGIAGYGIVQIVEAIEKDILKVRPNIIVICSWFNDSAAGGWYRMGDISDREAENRLKFLRKIEESWPYRTISRSRLYGLMRYYLLNLRDRIKQKLPIKNSGQDKKRRKRMNPKEFALELERIVELGKKNNFVPVFVYEPINRSFSLDEGLRRNKYYQAIKKVADVNGVPVVDTLTEFNKRRDEWLFYDFIHPNPEGHKITAEAIYQTLFATPANQWLRQSIKVTQN